MNINFGRKELDDKITVLVRWGDRSFKGNAKGVYLEIKSIGEEVKPTQMVEYAEEHPDSELHKCFTWDNDIAAGRWRIQEARLIQQNLKIQVLKNDNSDAKPSMVRAFYRTDSSQSAGYKETVRIIKNKDDYAGLLAVARAELKRFEEKYRILSNEELLKPIFDLIAEI